MKAKLLHFLEEPLSMERRWRGHISPKEREEQGLSVLWHPPVLLRMGRTGGKILISGKGKSC